MVSDVHEYMTVMLFSPLLTGRPDSDWSHSSGSGYFSSFLTKHIPSLRAVFLYLLHSLSTVGSYICEYSFSLTRDHCWIPLLEMCLMIIVSFLGDLKIVCYGVDLSFFTHVLKTKCLSDLEKSYLLSTT